MVIIRMMVTDMKVMVEVMLTAGMTVMVTDVSKMVVTGMMVGDRDEDNGDRDDGDGDRDDDDVMTMTRTMAMVVHDRGMVTEMVMMITGLTVMVLMVSGMLIEMMMMIMVLAVMGDDNRVMMPTRLKVMVDIAAMKTSVVHDAGGDNYP